MATRAYVESVIVTRAGATLLSLASVSTAIDGTNSDLNEPIRAALANLGILASDPSDVTDSEVGLVPPANISRLLDGAVYQTLLMLRIRLAVQIDRTTGENSAKWSQAQKAVEAILKAMEEGGQTGSGAGSRGPRAGAIRTATNPPEAWIRPRRL